jgi:hypothetical protein
MERNDPIPIAPDTTIRTNVPVKLPCASSPKLSVKRTRIEDITIPAMKSFNLLHADLGLSQKAIWLVQLPYPIKSGEEIQKPCTYAKGYDILCLFSYGIK